MGHGQCGPGKGELGVSQYRTGVLTYFPVVALTQVGMMVPSAPPHQVGLSYSRGGIKRQKAAEIRVPGPPIPKKMPLDNHKLYEPQFPHLSNGAKSTMMLY